MQKLIKLPKVLEMTTLSKASVYKMLEDGEFPKQVKLGDRGVAWVESDIQSWIDKKIKISKGSK